MLGEELGVSVQFVIINWKNKTAELNSKNIDCIWNGMTMTAELDQTIDFSVPYAENRQVAVVKTANLANYQTAESIKNVRIAVEQGSAGDTQATNTLQGTNISRVKDQVTALTEVSANTSDVAIIDLTMAQSIVGTGAYTDLSIIDVNKISFGLEEFAVGVRTDSNLKEKIDALYKKLYTNGTLQTLATKYGGIALNTTKLGAL
jgi:polar amino acid transport system substrate-binding protein